LERGVWLKFLHWNINLTDYFAVSAGNWQYKEEKEEGKNNYRSGKYKKVSKMRASKVFAKRLCPAMIQQDKENRNPAYDR
jgi:hypothetical protein